MRERYNAVFITQELFTLLENNFKITECEVHVLSIFLQIYEYCVEHFLNSIVSVKVKNPFLNHPHNFIIIPKE